MQTWKNLQKHRNKNYKKKMNKRPNFFHWYFNEGLHDLLEIWKNFLVFVLRFFSIFELLKTIFYPWHRDVSFAGWVGFHPILMLKMLVENVISRFLGAIVRMVVIAFGIICFFLAFFLGLIVVLVWISGPFLMIALAFFVFKSKINLIGGLLFLICWMFVIILVYYDSTKKSLTISDLKALQKTKVFERICGRIGIAGKRFPIEILESNRCWQNFCKPEV